MAHPKHPIKEINKVLDEADALGWRITLAKGSSSHAWGTMLCPRTERDGCRATIYGSPKHVSRHAKRLRSVLRQCSH